MSDERDSADAAGGGENTAALTQPLRPTGVGRASGRSTALAEFDDTGDHRAGTRGRRRGRQQDQGAQEGQKDGHTQPVPVRLDHHLKQVVAEMRKVIWPNPQADGELHRRGAGLPGAHGRADQRGGPGSGQAGAADLRQQVIERFQN